MKEGRNRSVRAFAAPKDGVKGVRGVLGVDMYLPLHFRQRTGSSEDDDETGRAPFGFPARRGWYLYPGY